MSTMIKNILCVVGTRPEAIKMAPIILKLQVQNWVNVSILATGQHKELLTSVLDSFGIKVDHNFEVMSENQSLASLTAKILSLTSDFFERNGKPDVVIVQGDTTTVFAICLAAFYLNIRIAHVEAGLRTFDIKNPFPEEMNRSFASKLASWHFAPTEVAATNLLREGISSSNILVTGNTVIDALFMVNRVPLKYQERIGNNKLILVTTHRRENFGKPLFNIFSALKKLASEYSDVTILIPLHPNPNLKKVAMEILSGYKNILLTAPLTYPEFVEAMKNAYLIISDSGGVQEEAPALGVPVLVIRGETERPEAIANGSNKLVGTELDSIYLSSKFLLDNSHEYLNMTNKGSPYGDGNAASRIVNRLHKDLII